MEGYELALNLSLGTTNACLSTHNRRFGHSFDWDHVEVVGTEPSRQALVAPKDKLSSDEKQ